MKKRIIISVVSDLSTDQRVLKVSQSCYEHGYEVFLIGRKMKNSLPLSLPFKTKRMKLLFNHSALFYAEFNIRLFFILLFARNDIFLSNDTDTLPANYLAAKIRNKKLVFDAHELFPEVPELVNRVRVKRFWEKIEDYIFPKLQYSYTVCSSIADYYNKKYGINMQVVRNVPYSRENINFRNLAFPGKKIILYQGALNIGRGIEWVIDSLPFIENAVLVIIGDGDIREQLEKRVDGLDLKDKVVFLGKIPAAKLHEYTLSADVGLCLLENKGLSYYYSLPNRIFDYIQAGVPVLATDFPEISSIVTKYHTGRVINHYEPQYLAKVLNEMFSTTYDFESAKKKLTWENEKKILLEIIG